jgi:hypothetical protein
VEKAALRLLGIITDTKPRIRRLFQCSPMEPTLTVPALLRRVSRDHPDSAMVASLTIALRTTALRWQLDHGMQEVETDEPLFGKMLAQFNAMTGINARSDPLGASFGGGSSTLPSISMTPSKGKQGKGKVARDGSISDGGAGSGSGSGSVASRFRLLAPRALTMLSLYLGVKKAVGAQISEEGIRLAATAINSCNADVGITATACKVLRRLVASSADGEGTASGSDRTKERLHIRASCSPPRSQSDLVLLLEMCLFF